MTRDATIEHLIATYLTNKTRGENNNWSEDEYNNHLENTMYTVDFLKANGWLPPTTAKTRLNQILGLQTTVDNLTAQRNQLAADAATHATRINQQRNDAATKLANTTAHADRLERENTELRHELNHWHSKFENVQGDNTVLKGRITDYDNHAAATARHMADLNQRINEQNTTITTAHAAITAIRQADTASQAAADALENLDKAFQPTMCAQHGGCEGGC